MEKLVEICRVCLENDQQDMHKIFDECLNNKIIIMTGLDVSKLQKTQKFYQNLPNFQLQPSDSLPKKICKSCRYQLEKSYYFRLLAKQSDTKLRKYTRLVNQKKEAGHVLDKEYKDDEIEELDEHMMESNVSFLQPSRLFTHFLPFLEIFWWREAERAEGASKNARGGTSAVKNPLKHLPKATVTT